MLVVCSGQWDILLRGICSEMKPKSKHTTNDGEPTLPPKLWQKKTVGGNPPVYPPVFFVGLTFVVSPPVFFWEEAVAVVHDQR